MSPSSGVRGKYGEYKKLKLPVLCRHTAFSKSDTMGWQHIPAHSCDFEARFTTHRKEQTMEKLITRKDAARILGISIATLDAARTSGLISYIQYVPNGCVYFTDAGLQEYVAKFTHRPRPEEKAATYRKIRRNKV